jgi:hypothetical protein
VKRSTKDSAWSGNKRACLKATTGERQHQVNGAYVECQIWDWGAPHAVYAHRTLVLTYSTSKGRALATGSMMEMQ